MRGKGRWSQWATYKPLDVRVIKVKGAWQVEDDTTITSGKVPGAGDYANAGVR